MRIQDGMPQNPYAAFALMTRRGAMGEDRGPLARRPSPPLASTSPVLRSQLLARAQRFDGLGEQLASLRASLQRFTPPANGPRFPGLETTAGDPLRSTTIAGGGFGGASAPAGSSAPTGGSTSATEPVRQEHAAVLLATHAILLAPGTPGTPGQSALQARLETDPIELVNQAKATLRGDKIQLNNKGDLTDFGTVTINGVETQLGTFRGESVEDAARYLAEKLNQNQQNTVVASVDPQSRDRVVLTSKIAGSASGITIDQVTRDASSKGSIGFRQGDFAQGSDVETDLGEVTINGVTTRFGKQRLASVQDAVRFMAERLNADHAGALLASAGGSNQDRLVLVSQAVGQASVIAVEGVKQGTDKKSNNDGNNGFTAGSVARGRDAEPGTPGDPGFTDFGRITLNGIETVFGLLDNRAHTAETAALFLAGRINETNATVHATVEDGRLMLTSTATGEGARIRVDAFVSDTDGNSGNDRALGFVQGASASGHVTVRQTPISQGGGTSGGGGGSATSSPTSASSGPSAPSSPANPGPEGTSADWAAQAKEWMGMTNGYLKELDERSQAHPNGEFRAFGRTIQAMMKGDSALAAVGVGVEGGRLQLDEAAFMQAYQEDPQVALEAMQRFRETLDPLLASQAHAFDFMRGVAQETLARAPEISQAKTMIYRLEQRGKEVSMWLETLEKLTPELSKQEERLRKLGTSEEAEDEAETEKTQRIPPEPEASTEWSSFAPTATDWQSDPILNNGWSR